MQLNQKQQAWASETLQRLASKMEKVAHRSKDKIPYTTIDGVHDDKSGDQIGWWTNGFWGGIMWQMYVLTEDPFYQAVAEDVEQKLDACLMDYQILDHDNGFTWLPTAVADYRVTGNPASKNRGMLAAGSLAGRYNTKGEYIRAWNDVPHAPDRRGWAIIDCMMNLPLLYWASEDSKDPRFAQIAVHHADTAMKSFIRGDGSANHIVEFDLETGEMVTSYGGQGMAEGSSWTRGQSWALYGFVLSYIHTKDQKYLDTAQRVANYFLASVPGSGRIPVDFRQPVDVDYEDDTAAAIAACGLIELARQIPGRQGEIYLQAAIRLLRVLTDECVSWDENVDHVLQYCSARYHEKEHGYSIIYGDYYYLEALMKLNGKDLMIW